VLSILLKNVNQTYLGFKNCVSLLLKLGTDDLKDLVKFLCNSKTTNDDIFSKHSRSEAKRADLRSKPL
jgi:hypothetical protein